MSSLSSAAAPARTDRGPQLRLSQLGDELLARQASRGSERAFTAIYERYHQPLYRYCRSILRNDSDAQDALQSTFVGALQALRRDQRSAPLRPWLYRIAHNEAISLLRRRTRDASDELDAQSLGVGASVEQEAADRARWRSLVEDLSSLPERQRGALLLRELNGLSHEEIAIALGTSTAAAKQSIFEARQALAEIAEGRAMSCEDVRQRISEGDRRVLRGRRVTAHLRQCAGCEAFALAIPERRAQLRALTPVLPSATAATLLSRSLQAGGSHGGISGASAAAGAGVAGKAVGTALVWKAVAGVAIVASTAAGATGISHLLTATHASPAAPSHTAHARAASSHARASNPAGATHRAYRGAPAERASRAVHHKSGSSRSTSNTSSAAVRSGPSAARPNAHGRSSSAPGHGATPPGHSSTPRGRSSTSPGHSSAPRGKSSTSLGQRSAPRGRSSNPARHTGASRRRAAIHAQKLRVPKVRVNRVIPVKATVKKALTPVPAGRSSSVRTHTPSR